MRTLALLLLGAALAAASMIAAAGSQRDAQITASVAGAESLYLDVLNAASALGAIDSGQFRSFQGRDRAGWAAELATRRAAFDASLAGLDRAALTPADAAALSALLDGLAEIEAEGATSDAGDASCRDAARKDLDYGALRDAVQACFREIGNALRFEGGTVDRGSALQLLYEIEEPARREALFDAFAPLWAAVNGANEPDSPYRRMIVLAAENAARDGSEVDAAARALGVTVADVERWLVEVLDAWRSTSDPALVEPWDYRYVIGEAGRRLASRTTAASLVPANERFYRDLGADLGSLGVAYDLGVRPDKSPVAYADFLVRGRYVDGRWQPSIARVVGMYPVGGLFSLNELVHENAHAVQLTAVRNRPAHTGWADTLFVEAFADVTSWSVYEPAWQRRYLGSAAPDCTSMRALHGTVMLDVAWALFEIRMLRDPASDPNAVWTDITSHYLRIVPHPGVPWWAMRVQLASDPGYMVNYGLGAVLTAEMRRRIAEAIGPFDAGNPAWHGWVSERLLVFGSERDTLSLMQSLLGRPVTPAALIEQIRRCRC